MFEVIAEMKTGEDRRGRSNDLAEALLTVGKLPKRGLKGVKISFYSRKKEMIRVNLRPNLEEALVALAMLLTEGMR